MNTAIEIDAYEAQTKLPELLHGVQAGYRYTVTVRGTAVADLVPAGSAERAGAVAAVDEMRVFMKTNASSRKFDLKVLLDEGRA